MEESIILEHVFDIALLALLTIAAFAVVFLRQLLVSVLVFSIFSLLMAMMYTVMGAPDVAITEAAVGAGISTILFLAALLHIGETEKKPNHPFLPLIVVLITGAALIYATMDIRPYGVQETVTNSYVAKYYIDNVYDHMGFPNIVTGILASYRGFDTFGEVVVIFTALVASLLVLGPSARKSRKN